MNLGTLTSKRMRAMASRRLRAFQALVLLITACAFALGSAQNKPTPPGQAASGPGGSDYPHAAVIKNCCGEGDTEYWLFEPAEPAPQRAPLVLFLHGFGGMYPGAYGAWIEHLVRKGNVVVYPRYQATIFTPSETFTGNTITAVKDAIKTLESPGHVPPDLEKFGIIGHSAGGGLAANLAALADTQGLPHPRALMLLEPGDGSASSRMIRGYFHSYLVDVKTIPSDILMLIISGEEVDLYDRLGSEYSPAVAVDRKIWEETTQIPPQNKDFIIVPSDAHGETRLIGGHFSPCAPDDRYYGGPTDLLPPAIREAVRRRLLEAMAERGTDFSRLLTVDALDYYCYWKLFDALTDAAFWGRNRQYALGNTPQQRYMGQWSDGTPVKELTVSDAP